ncbi:unnamed protein product [Euphydryas editha]|uniref:Endonuclease/exonuclease/phosphatase domain-containing protein n=1 Tax=Euphydryas editha TaxID=104508 RepID=A0AAU9UBZ3_EUPED|nr:unnamed protein product [Euphydryas editha]
MGGGVLIAVKTNIPVRSSSSIEVKNFAGDVIRISIPLQIGPILKQLHIYCCYFPHGKFHVESLCDCFDAISNEILLHPDDHYFIIGDFNITNCIWDWNGEVMTVRNFDDGNPGVESLFGFLNITDLKQFNRIPNGNGRYLDS